MSSTHCTLSTPGPHRMFNLPSDGNVSALGPALLFVHVEWCGYCREAKPVMEKVAATLGTIVPVFSVDGDQHKDLAKALGVASYPTIVYVNAEGKLFVYKGERTYDSITSFVCHNSSDRHEFCKAI